jgi:tetratricopeptide (TPR) repeat protein
MNFLAGQKLVKQKEYGKALSVFLNLLKNGIENKNIFFYLGLIYSELNDFNKSVFNYNKYLKVNPNSKAALLNLAIAKQSIGEINAAKDIYLKLIDLDRSKIRAYFGLIMLDINFLTDDHYTYIKQLKKNDEISLYEKSLINFILARREKNNKNHKKEIEYLKKFNENSFNSNYAYNQTSQFYYEKIINNFFDKIKFKDNRKTLEQKNNLLPIFIIGLPRSGSTLIESILTSGDEKIKTCAESHVINISLLEQIGPKIFNKDFDMKEFEFKIDLIEFEQSVLNRYDKFEIINQDNGSFFIDKSLENFFNIEIILKIYPNAKFYTHLEILLIL